MSASVETFAMFRSVAETAGRIMFRAIKAAGLSVGDRLERVELEPEGSADGPLAGQAIEFTGALRMVRQKPAAAGSSVEDTVSKRTTLAVGDQDIRRPMARRRAASTGRPDGWRPPARPSG